ncbi:hypothetical protein AAF712_010777 [Marasmius tenuissimus]|uniref:Uncharacterized protein n=1 Tax=Marasmius tenuissimus TaxID=585030 RepID=A0ABR2ZLB5_9AGAR
MGIGQSLLEQDTDSEYDIPQFPSEDDVVTVRLLLVQLLPRELVDIIIDEAEYWVRACIGERNTGLTALAGTSDDFNCSYCYLLTQSIPLSENTENDVRKRPVRVQQIIFTTTSHDQGWGGPEPEELERYGPYHGSWSWFEASIVRARHAQSPAWIKGVRSEPMSLDNLRTEDSTITDAVMVGPPPKRWFIHSNRTADRNFTQRTTAWSIHDDDIVDDYLLRGRVGKGREFLSLLEPGDRIALLVRARFPGWVNYVQDASVEILYSV